MSNNDCALCGSKIMSDDISVTCVECGKYMCAFCSEATEVCCVVIAEPPPALLPINAGVIAFALLFLVLPFMFYLMDQNNSKQYSEYYSNESLNSD